MFTNVPAGDLHDVELLLDRLEVFYSLESSGKYQLDHSLNGISHTTLIIAPDGSDKVAGDEDSFAEMHFDKDGKFLKLCIWN